MKRSVSRRLNFESSNVPADVDDQEKSMKRRKAAEECEGACTSRRMDARLPAEDSSSPILFRGFGRRVPASSTPISNSEKSDQDSPIIATKCTKRKNKRFLQTSPCGRGSEDVETAPRSPVFTFKNVPKGNKGRVVSSEEANAKPSCSYGTPEKRQRTSFAFGDAVPEFLSGGIRPRKRSKYPEIPFFTGSREVSIGHAEATKVAVRTGINAKPSEKTTEESEAEVIEHDEDESGSDSRDGDENDRYEIEEFSQDSSREDVDAMVRGLGISSYSSLSDSMPDEVRERFTATTTGADFSIHRTPPKSEGDEIVPTQDFDSEKKKKKRSDKNGLVAQFNIVKRKQESERRIREHRLRIMKEKEDWKKTVRILEKWEEGGRFVLKCNEISVAEDGTLPETDYVENLYVYLTQEIKYDCKKIEAGSFLRIAPPWLELRHYNLDANVLLAVSTIELIDEMTGATLRMEDSREVPLSKFKCETALLCDTLIKSHANPFLCRTME